MAGLEPISLPIDPVLTRKRKSWMVPPGFMTRVAVIGAGAWGTALGRLLAMHRMPVALWTWQSEHAAAIRRDRENAEFFPGFDLPVFLSVTADIADALRGADVVLLTVPSDVFRDVLSQLRPHVSSEAVLVGAT